MSMHLVAARLLDGDTRQLSTRIARALLADHVIVVGHNFEIESGYGQRFLSSGCRSACASVLGGGLPVTGCEETPTGKLHFVCSPIEAGDGRLSGAILAMRASQFEAADVDLVRLLGIQLAERRSIERPEHGGAERAQRAGDARTTARSPKHHGVDGRTRSADE